MNYYKWNQLIGDYFFKPKGEGRYSYNGRKTIFLYMTKKDLLQRFREVYPSDDRDENSVWKDFVEAVNFPKAAPGELNDGPFSPPPIRSFANRTLRLWQYPYQRPTNYPLYLTMLCVMVMGKTETETLNDRPVKAAVKKFFDDNSFIYDEDDFCGNGMFAKLCENINGDIDGGVWKHLHEWSLRNGSGTVFFADNKKKNNTYVKHLTDQCLMSSTVKVRIRELYGEAGLNTNEKYTLEVFKGRLMTQSKKFTQYFNNQNAKNAIFKDDTLVKVLYSDFLDWDGTFEDVTNTDSKTASRHTRGCYFLRLCCHLDRNEKSFRLEYRLRDTFRDPIKVTVVTDPSQEEVIKITPEFDGWSSPLPIKEIKPLEGKEHSARFVFNENKDDIYFLKNERELGGPGFYSMVAADGILSEGARVFFMTRNDVDTSLGKGLQKLNFTNSEGYSLYRYMVDFNDSIMNDGGMLAEYKGEDKPENSDKPILKGGLETRSHVYMPYNLPYIENASNDDTLTLYDDSGNVVDGLVKEDEVSEELENSNVWILPNEMKCGGYKLKNGKGSISFSIQNTEYLSSPIVEHPKFAIDGTVLSEEQVTECPYESDNQVHLLQQYNDDYPQIELCHSRNTRLDRSDSEFVPNAGDYLIEWLYFKGKCSLKDFEDAYSYLQFDLIQSSTELEKNTRDCYPGSALKWLINGGFVDFDGSYIYPCSPRFIPLPVEKDHCNEFRLIGCRPLYLVRKIMNVCIVHMEMLFFHSLGINDNYLKTRLTPSNIYVQAKDKGNTDTSGDYGFSTLQEMICEPLGIKSPEKTFLMSRYAFIQSTTDVDNLHWYDVISAAPSSQNICYMFDCQQYEYAKNPLSFSGAVEETEDGLFAFIKMKPFKEYKYKSTFLIIDKSKMRYAEIENESMGKLYVMHKNFNRFVASDCFIQQGDKGIAVSRRVGLPLSLSKTFSFMSIQPPVVSTINNKRYYVYIFPSEYIARKMRSFINDKLGLLIKVNNINPNINI